MARWQDRLTPLQRRIAGGCHLNRPIDRLVEGAGAPLRLAGQRHRRRVHPARVLALTHFWQRGALALAFAWLIGLRRGVVPAVVPGGAIGALAVPVGAPSVIETSSH